MKYLLGVSTLELFSNKCTGCGTCVDVCPHGVLAMKEKRAIIVDRNNCMECGACMTNCASYALRVNKGVGCAAAIINSIISGGEPSCDCSGDTNKARCC